MWAAVIGAVVAAIGMIVNSSQANKQASHNMDLAKFQAQSNENYLQKQLDYNTPANQMGRFQSAGLNPHLIYGQGSPGNQTSPLSFPDIKPADYQRQNLDQLVPLANQTMMVQSQVAANNARTLKANADTKLVELQRLVLEKNPLLDNEGYKAIIEGLKATATLKEEQGKGQKLSNFFNESTMGTRGSKILAEWRLLEQRFNLGTQDSAIKAEVLKSKEFQNAISEVQKKFLADGEVGPQQIYQFILLLLTKSL